MTPRRRLDSPRAKETRPAAEAIVDALELYGISEEVRAGRIVTEWAELVGPKVAQRTRPDGVADRVLWIEVASSAWLHELSLLKPQLVMGLVDRLGQPRLFDEVRFRLAGRSRPRTLTAPPPRRRPPPPPRVPTPATGAARERIAREVAEVDDAELRELIARVRVTHDR
ncbi:MAG: DUF721 domain-containing protein [Deltaproteobacteria bacterium]|nr:DUF721 domain-containing protein [Deltaproteobacteria bacterium]